MISTRLPKKAWPLGSGAVLLAVLALTVVKPFGAHVAPPAKAPGEGCPHVGQRWGQVGEADYEQALVCQINRARTARGLRTLTVSPRLARAAERHALDMDRRDYFAHVSPSGSTPTRRARATRYLPGVGRWKVGEDLGWGRGPDSTAREVFDDWMRSTSHRRQILTRAYRNIGVGTEAGSPGFGTEAETVTIVAAFGHR